MNERLSAEELDAIRTYGHYYGYANTAVRKLCDHIDALTDDLDRAERIIEFVQTYDPQAVDRAEEWVAEQEAEGG